VGGWVGGGWVLTTTTSGARVESWQERCGIKIWESATAEREGRKGDEKMEKEMRRSTTQRERERE
jgi:hypothetical protein